MEKGRLEAFSDGVIAIIITIMVLELKAPHGADLVALKPLAPVFLSYVLSFIYVAIYWTNHHHLLQAATRVTGPILMANLFLLFWLSMIPFATGWMGENNFARFPVQIYGAVLLASALAYSLLAWLLVRSEGPTSILGRAIGRDLKGKISLVLYLVGIAASAINPALAMATYVLVAVIWFVPDLRIERLFRG